MPVHKKKSICFDPVEKAKIIDKLLVMVNDMAYNTTSTFSADSDQYPDNLIPFVDKHINYLSAHPSADPYMYIANLRLMTRIR